MSRVITANRVAALVGDFDREPVYRGLAEGLRVLVTDGRIPVVLNPAAFTHYSYAVHDAIAQRTAPLIEVHITNPAARSDPASPIYGMPILDVDKAASIVVLKRSLNPGFAGIDNELYLDPKTTMLFGDAKESVLKLISAVKAS